MSDRSKAAREAEVQPASANPAVLDPGSARSKGRGEEEGQDTGRGSRPRHTGSRKKSSWFGGDQNQAIAFYGEFYR